MTLKEHVLAIKNLISKGASSDDSAYTWRLIAHFLNVARAILTEQKADKYVHISEQSFQSLCVPLELSVFHGCCAITDIECKVLRSASPLPKFLNTRWGDFAKVMTLVGEIISKTSMTADKYSKYTISNSIAKPGYFIHNNYLYIKNNKVLEMVLLNSLFSDPSVIEQTNCATNTGTNCADFFDVEYPMDPDLIVPAYKLVLDLIGYSMKMPPQDLSNDAKDDQASII